MSDGELEQELTLAPLVEERLTARKPFGALCLSGGGYRAALFHLGGLRRLNELGVLHQIDVISAVSGGSVIAAHLARAIAERGGLNEIIPPDEWDRRIAAPFHDFVRNDIRTGPLKKRLLRPWNWTRSRTAVVALADEYERLLGDFRLDQLPDAPAFTFSATDLTFGVNWVFEKGRVGDYQAGYCSPPPEMPLARAVAASSCFPPIFDPMPLDVLKLKPGDLKKGVAASLELHTPERAKRRDELVRGIQLNDGGNYDNLGLEPVWRDKGKYPAGSYILVSDGGGTFEFQAAKRFYQRLMRYPAVLSNQVTALRFRWLADAHRKNHVGATFWKISSAPERYSNEREGKFFGGYSKGLASDYIAPIRTDLDAFSPGEVAVLENHGYLLADAAVRRWLPHLVASDAPLAIPHPDFMDEATVRQVLKGSNKRKIFGRKG